MPRARMLVEGRECGALSNGDGVLVLTNSGGGIDAILRVTKVGVLSVRIMYIMVNIV